MIDDRETACDCDDCRPEAVTVEIRAATAEEIAGCPHCRPLPLPLLTLPRDAPLT